MKGVMSANEVIREGPNPMWLVSLLEQEMGTQTGPEGKPVKTQGEDSHPQAEEKGLRRDQLCRHLDLRLPPPEL